MFSVYFTYADYRVQGYEHFGAEKHLDAEFDSKRAAWNWMRTVEKRAIANDMVLLDSVTVRQDGKVVYVADYNRQQFIDLYDHVDCHGGVWRYVRVA